MIVARHVRKGIKRFRKEKLRAGEILEAFGENVETGFVLVNGRPVTSDKLVRPGDKILVFRGVSGD